jgi:hypothetical protein
MNEGSIELHVRLLNEGTDFVRAEEVRNADGAYFLAVDGAES